ncbi:hypothetical protein KEM55_008192 [Ascosphaera atra]|nr:hypothetical protein KEM55_008192 [Ascosphaera atra]
MGDEKHKYEPIPIPSYEEAVASSSRRPSNQHEEEGSGAEREGLLQSSSNENNTQSQTQSGRSSNYRPPTVESARSSVDRRDSESSSARGSTEALRHELEQMDVEDQSQSSPCLRSRIRRKFSSLKTRIKEISRPITSRLSCFHLRLDFRNIYANGIDMEGQKCMIFLRLFALFLVMSIVYAIFVSDVFSFRKMNMGQIFEPESVRVYAQGQVNATMLGDNLKRVTQYPHIAGTEGNYALAQFVESRFKDSLMDEVSLEQFDVYLNYPKKDGRRVAIVEPQNLAWEAKIDEEKAFRDREQTLVFHGHSKSGNVTGPLVYANYGSREDFKKLEELGVKVKGSIALVRYYGTQGDRALKIKAAELAGAAGCIIYSDPNEDGYRRGPAFPDGRYMPADGVQRGAVSLMSWVVGDVLSPGWASDPDEKKRLKLEESEGLVNIPSIPLSWRDAQHLLKALKGHGKEVPKEWVGGVPEIDQWWTGDDGKDAPRVNLMNMQDEVERQPIYNVIGYINGMEDSEKKVVIGAHRDAWCYGAVDPGSGQAVLIEVARVLGELRLQGWRPLRTIEIASWDGEEYNLIGSTEHVEKHIDQLRADGVVYINVDSAVSGRDLKVQGNPIFKEALERVLEKLTDPATGENLKKVWDKKKLRIQGLGAGSDYVAFQDMAGTSSIDLAFVGDPYPYHSCYDNYDFMVKYGDPGFQYHKLLTQIWVALILEFSDSAILPFDIQNYASAVAGYVDDLEKYAHEKKAQNVNMKVLHDAAHVFQEEAKRAHHRSHVYNKTLMETGGFETGLMAGKRRGHNALLSYFDTRLLDLDEDGGVPNRTQFKHIIYGPQTWSGYDEAFFPAIRDAIDAGDWSLTQRWIDKVANKLSTASKRL